MKSLSRIEIDGGSAFTYAFTFTFICVNTDLDVPSSESKAIGLVLVSSIVVDVLKEDKEDGSRKAFEGLWKVFAWTWP